MTADSANANNSSAPKSMDAIMSLCKRRGFIYQASEIYGGINGFWDYGPLGAQMKKNLREAWWQDMILNPCWGQKGPNGQRVECVPVETRIIQHPKVWEASGHVGGFNDPMVDDKETKQRFRADHLQALIDCSSVNPEDTARYQQLFAEAERAGLLISVVKTVVAASESDAIEALKTDSKLRKSIGIRSITERGVLPGTVSARLLEVDWGEGPKACVIRAMPIKQLEKYAATIPSPFTGKAGHLTEPRQFNLMFISYTGAIFSEDNKVYLRPETAQGVFTNFKNVVDTTRVKVPFGIGNTGTSFRNEITPRNYTFRSREFEQAELEFFCHPDESFEWYKFWRDFRMAWWQSIGLAGDNLILREHDKDELSHYSVGTSDVEYRFPFTAPGFGELEGIAHRGNYDLTQHQKHSGAKLEYFDQQRGELLPNGSRRGERYLPHCIEPAAGLDRGVLALLCEAYTKDESRPSPEFMKLHPRIAPIKAAIFPLVAKDGMPEIAEKLYNDVRAKFGKIGFIEFDEKQTIGKRYARMDEAGCPFCFTIDGETAKDNTVTMRDRDSGQQTRMSMDQVVPFLTEKLGV
ncbi:MAG TPA: glycine--tRNA ligase [Phycisphaerales bacterium]|nr:glycine--tRNA ligase [Phycisphaerales bacterium]